MNLCQCDCINTDCEKHDMNLIQSSSPGENTFSDQSEGCKLYEPMASGTHGNEENDR